MHLTVTTPRGSLVQIEVDEIAAPGALGEFGVLPGHVPFMTALKPGVLFYRTKEGPRFLAVGDGVLQVAHSGESDKISVLVDRGEPARDIDRDTAAQELAAVDAELAKTKAETAAEVKALLGKRAWAAARVDAANRVK
jgi:F-type H+-transporting ATPase subunit epsilon